MDSYYDIIERFLDGSTTSAENEQLYTQLATDVQLQRELQMSMSIRRAMEFEASTIKAPADVLDAIMVTATQQGLISSATAPTLLSRLVSLLLPVVGWVAIGGLASYLIFGTSRQSDAGYTSAQPAVSVPARAPVEEASRHDRTHLSLHGSVASSASLRQSAGRQYAKGAVAARRYAESTSPLSVSHSTSQREGIDESNPEDEITYVQLISAVTPALHIRNTQDVMFEWERPDLYEGGPLSVHDRFEFRFHTQAAGRDMSGPQQLSQMSNYGGDIGYRLNDGLSVGFSFNHMVLPQDTAMFCRWWSTYFRAVPDIGLPLGIRPYGQFNIGGNERGVVLCPSIGLTLPINMFTLSVGADVTAVLDAVHNYTPSSETMRPAARIAVGVTF